MVDAPLLVSVREAARRLGIGRDHAYELVRSGTLRSVAIGDRKRLVPVVELDRWILREIDDEEAP